VTERFGCGTSLLNKSSLFSEVTRRLLRQLRLMEAEDIWHQVKKRDTAMMTSDVG
jgi:hypothetical protein